MQNLIGLLRWILKAAIFFILFAFALNNQHEVVAHFFFGNQWKAPLVVIVLLAFTAGMAVGVLGMLSRSWRRRAVSSSTALTAAQTPLAPSPAVTAVQISNNAPQSDNS